MNKEFVFAAAVSVGMCGLTQLGSAAVLAEDAFNYTAGTDLAGNTAPVGGTWGSVVTTTGNGVIDPMISPVNLNHANRPANAGNSVDIDGSNPAGSAKLPGMPDQTAANTGNGTIYYSLLLNVNDITGTSNAATGSFIAGYSINDSISPAVASITTSAGVLLIRGDQDVTTSDDFFNLGVGVTENNADRVFSTTPLSPGTTYFVVVGYQFGPGTDDDVATLHINPLPETYGAVVAPAADLISAGATNATQPDRTTLASFFLRNNAVAPAETLIDDLRIGSTYADVTAIPEPTAVAALALGVAGLMARRRRA